MPTHWRRRQLLRAGGTAGLASLAGCSDLSSVLGGGGGVTDWPTYQGGPEHRGVSAAAGPGSNPTTRWEQTADDLVEPVATDPPLVTLSPPITVDGTVYVTLTGRSVEKRLGVHLYALEAADGSVDWRTELLSGYVQTLGGTMPTPTAVDGTIVVTVPNPAAPNTVIGVDAANGDVRWESGANHLPITGGTPTDGGAVFGARTVYALDGGGDLAWEYGPGERPPRALGGEPPTVSGKTTYVATVEQIVAVDDGGTEQWSRTLSQENELGIPDSTSSPAVGDAVYVATGSLDRQSDGRLVALDPASGTNQWEFQPAFESGRREQNARAFYEEHDRSPPIPPVGVYGTPVLSDGTLFVRGMALHPEEPLTPVPKLYAVDAADGTKRWERTLPSHFGLAPPVLAGGVVYVGVESGVAAIDAESGSLLATPGGSDSFVQGLAVAGDSLYVGRARSVTALGPGE